MHEFGPVEALVENLLLSDPVRRAQSLRIRVGGSMILETVRHAFKACTAGTTLEQTKLDLEERIIALQCRCGRPSTVNATEQYGCPLICPTCGELIDVPPGPALELMEIVYEQQLKAAS